MIESICTKKIFRLNCSQIRESSSSRFSLHWHGYWSNAPSPGICGSSCQIRGHPVMTFHDLSLCIMSQWSQTHSMQNVFHLYGFPLPPVHVAGYHKTAHQPYALVHTAFFLNSGRALKDSRVAKETKQSAQLHLERSCRSKRCRYRTWLFLTWLILKTKKSCQALGRILMAENH